MHPATADQIPLFGEDADEDVDDMPVVRRVVDARTTSAPVTRAPRSVFELGIIEAAQRLKARGRFGDAAGFKAQKAKAPTQASPVKATIERTPGVTRHIGASYPVRWTEEDQERERQRRARQKPPRPPRKAKTRGKKLLDLIGPDDEFDSDA